MAGAVAFTAKEDGLRAVLTATRPEDGRGLYKAWVLGPTGRFLLGTMAPEGGRLSIRRTVSLDELRRCGAWPVREAQAELSFAFAPKALPPGWRETDGRGLLPDRDLARQAAELAGLLIYTDRGGFFLAAPWTPHRPFPMEGLFCFAALEELGGVNHAIFCFDRAGRPCFPNNGRRTERY